ncbi:MAG: LysM peptidoglycan-binding domain-containing protein [Pseudobdellovibrionaceae bacterium]
MKHQVVMIFLSLIIAACSTKRKVVESPLFNKSAPPETKEEIEKLPKVTQSQIVADISPEIIKPPPQPRTILTADRKAPPKALEVTPPIAIKKSVPAPVAVAVTPPPPPPPTEEDLEYIIYTAKGGEKLSFVARSLLGSPRKTALLKKWNKKISKSSLRKGQEIKVKTEALKPKPIYLSRSLVTKYKKQLRDHLTKKSPTKTYIVKNGQTLQTISKKLYSTTRRWTELYLFNYEKMNTPDSLEKGTEIKHY